MNLFNRLKILLSSHTKTKIFAFLTLLIVVLAVPLTIFISSQNQDIRQRATSLSSSTQTVNILVLKYLPTDASGNNLNFSILGLNTAVGTMNSWIDLQNQQTVEKLTESTAYHRYKDAAALPSIEYTIFDTKEFKKPLPRHTLSALGADGANWTDYPKILSTDVQICNYVDNQNVKEVWIWGYQIDSGPNQTKIHESNMSMGTNSRAFWNQGGYGNISNSPRLNNLPQCQKTYTVYTFNYYGYPGSALHNTLHVYGHQFEAIMDWLDPTVWDTYTFPIGYGAARGVTNHCGTMHSPPNSVNRSLVELQPKLNPGDTSQCGNPQTTSACEGMQDYSVSVVSVPSDCEDWSPDGGGVVAQVDCRNWYRKPDGTCPPFQSIEAEGGAYFYVWWRQNIPGMNNTKTYRGIPLRNWWEFFADFDDALATKGKRLTSTALPTPTPFNCRQFDGNVSGCDNTYIQGMKQCDYYFCSNQCLAKNTPLELACPQETATPTPISPQSRLGDATGEGDINTQDFNIWKDEFLDELAGNTSSKKSNFHKDNQNSIDVRDFNIWKNEFLKDLGLI